MSPPAFLTSGIVGMGTKLALLRDAMGKTTPPENDESIGDFVRRKFSAQMLDRLVGPFVSGVYAGDAEKLSLRSAFPTLYDAEKHRGSVIRGMISKSTERKPSEPRQRPTLLSFREGTRAFTDALAAKLGERLVLNANAIDVAATDSNGRSPYQVTVQTDNEQRSIAADHIIVATPTYVAATLLRGLDPTMAGQLTEIEYAPIAVVLLGYRKQDVGDPLNGFGFLVPRSAGIRTLGTVWNSSLFPNRAPDGHVLLTSFIGGATDREVMEVSFQRQLVPLVHKEIAPLLRIRAAAPAFSRTWMYARALPQYNVGHGARLDAIESARSKHANVWLTGNYLRGPSIGACVEQSLAVAQQIAQRINSRQNREGAVNSSSFRT